MLLAIALSALCLQEPEPSPSPLSVDQLRAAGQVAGHVFTDEELTQLLRTAVGHLRAFERMRAVSLPNAVPPALTFRPIGEPEPARPATEPFPLPDAERPADLDELAFGDIATLASLIKSGKVSCEELCELFLARLQEADKKLHCVITLTPERARKRAVELDALLERGEWLGVLHGIPFGAKDLLSAKGYRTTWGAKPFENQVIDEDAAVIENLEARGAVLIAKLSLGALAWGDVWFGGKTRNPWNTEQGSSGSSAGPAAATAAGAVPFAIGSETLGSIVSPSVRCGTTGLRPTFGVVDTRGAMTLSWSMDKLGPLCRSAEDAALVLEAMLGDAPGALGYRFEAAALDDVAIEGMRVGFIESSFKGRRGAAARGVLDELRGLGVELVPIELPDYPLDAVRFLLNCEAAAAFDELTRSGRDDLLVRQVDRAWPNTFRAARLVPAVEYIQAQRVRTLAMRDMEEVMRAVDVYVHPTSTGLLLTNLTGHPTIVAPRGEGRGGGPGSIGFTGRLYGELKLLALVRAWQDATEYDEKHPVLR